MAGYQADGVESSYDVIPHGIQALTSYLLKVCLRPGMLKITDKQKDRE